MVGHLERANRPASPGTRADGTPFGGAPAEPAPPSGPRLILNEVLADPYPGIDANGDGEVGSTEDEYVEILNVGDRPASLDGVRLRDRVRVRVELEGQLDAGAALVVFGGGTVGAAYPPDAAPAVIEPSLGLNNGGDTLTLETEDGTLLDRLDYGSEGGDDSALVREVDGDPEAGWGLHRELFGRPASPGLRADGRPF
jgi:hypothetical protein